MSANDEPMFLYVFNGQGMHTGKQPLANMNECHDAIRKAIKDRETVTITDSGDCCVFRCERGVVCWPRLTELYGGDKDDGD